MPRISIQAEPHILDDARALTPLEAGVLLITGKGREWPEDRYRFSARVLVSRGLLREELGGGFAQTRRGREVVSYLADEHRGRV